jgi:hypothetical protein
VRSSGPSRGTGFGTAAPAETTQPYGIRAVNIDAPTAIGATACCATPSMRVTATPADSLIDQVSVDGVRQFSTALQQACSVGVRSVFVNPRQSTQIDPVVETFCRQRLREHPIGPCRVSVPTAKTSARRTRRTAVNSCPHASYAGGDSAGHLQRAVFVLVVRTESQLAASCHQNGQPNGRPAPRSPSGCSARAAPIGHAPKKQVKTLSLIARSVRMRDSRSIGRPITRTPGRSTLGCCASGTPRPIRLGPSPRRGAGIAGSRAHV